MTAGETQTRHIEACGGDTSALLEHVRAFSPVYRFALFTGSFWSCHYRPVKRDIDCICIALYTMYDDISSTVIMLHQFDQ